MSDDTASQSHAYVLGHTDHELERLEFQARLIDPMTRRFFEDAGIVPGMRVLDVGSGAGDVAFLLADMIGETGEVVGVDRSAKALAVAKTRASDRSLRNVSFQEGDPTETTFERPFDAVAGRYILMFQADPAAMLRGLSPHLRPGGVLVFHELDWEGSRSYPTLASYDKCWQWIAETLVRHGTEEKMAMKLHTAFVGAGLSAPSMGLGAVAVGGANAEDYLRLMAHTVRSFFPEMERLGVATAADVGLETLAKRMVAEATANESVIIGRSEIGAWTRVQG